MLRALSFVPLVCLIFAICIATFCVAMAWYAAAAPQVIAMPIQFLIWRLMSRA